MRARNELDRLAAAGRPLHAQADALVGAGEEDAILKRIIATDRGTPRAARRRPMTLALVGAVVLAALAVVAALEIGNRNNSANGSGNVAYIHMDGAEIQVAGYRFHTPSGFGASDTSCPGAPASDGANGFAAAAAAHGRCVEAFLEMPDSAGAPSPLSADAIAVEAGAYKGYLGDGPMGGALLYVELPAGPEPHPYLVLYSKGLADSMLFVIATSGLPEGTPQMRAGPTGQN